MNQSRHGDISASAWTEQGSLRPTAWTERPPRTTSIPGAPQGHKPPRGAALASVFAVAVACASAMAQAHVTRAPHAQIGVAAPSIRRSETGKNQRWQQREVTVSVDDSLDAFGTDVHDSVEKAFAAWTNTGAEIPTFRFEHAKGLSSKSTPDGQNTIIVAPIDIAGHKTDIAITISFTDSNSGEILEEDIILNSRYFFKLLPDDIETKAKNELAKKTGNESRSDSALYGGNGLDSVADVCQDSYDVQGVVTHEVGHFLGLGDDQDEAANTMYIRTNECETHKRVLKTPDADAVREVYKDGFEDRGQVQCSVQAGRGPGQLGAAGAFLALLATVARRLRRRAA